MLQVETQLPFLIWSVGEHACMKKTVQFAVRWRGLLHELPNQRLVLSAFQVIRLLHRLVGTTQFTRSGRNQRCMLKFVLAAETP
jgi:hypothetical protein